MEIVRKGVSILAAFILFILCTVSLEAKTDIEGENADEGNQIIRVKSVRAAGAFRAADQGYRITLLDKSNEYQPLYSIDLVSHEVEFPSAVSDGYYGFEGQCYLDMDNSVMDDIFEEPFVFIPPDINGDVNVFYGYGDKVVEALNSIVGQCKLFYISNLGQRDLGVYSENYLQKLDDWTLRENDKYKLSEEKRIIITAEDFNNGNYGYSIPVLRDNSDTVGSEFYFINCNDRSGTYKYASFYDKKIINDPRFLSSLYSCFKDNMGEELDPARLNDYTLMFEPIVWFYDCKPDENEDDFYAPMYSFYGTVTELAYIQNSCVGWRYTLGFVGKRAQTGGESDSDIYNIGVWLEEMQVISFTDGLAMMVNEETAINEITLGSYSDYKTDEPESVSYYGDEYIDSDYVVENMGVALLDYHPQITYKAQNYEYRTNTDVVTSIKLTNNGKNDLLPSYVSVHDHLSDNAEEPIAVGALLEYKHDDGTYLTSEEVNALGLPETVSVQGIGSEVNFGHNGVGCNEAYLYFKWKTPEEPMKINVVARFIGDNNRSPMYIEHEVGSIEGKVCEYDGTDPSYSGRYFTTVGFSCDVSDTMSSLRENNGCPDFIGGFMDSSYKAEQYEQNAEIFNSYDPLKSFEMKNYLNGPDNEPDKVEELSWYEYTVFIQEQDNELGLRSHKYTARSGLLAEDTGEVALPFTDIPKIKNSSVSSRPLILFDYVPQGVIKDGFGKSFISTLSGYGFSFAFNEEFIGDYDTDPDNDTALQEMCTMFQNGVMLFPEFNYSPDHIAVIETAFDSDGDDSTFDCIHALSVNDASKYKSGAVGVEDISGPDDLKSRVHFIPVWFPDNTEYRVEVIMFDYWTPAGQIYDCETYTLRIDGNIYDNWYASKSDRNQKK